MNFEYAPDGTLRSVENPLGETLLTFSDEIGRVADQILPDSSLVSFEYDRSSDPVKVILPHGEEHGFGHNPVGQTERYSAPPTGSVPTNTLWTYNVARQPVATIKPDGTVISNAHDSAGRLVSVTASRDGESDSIDYAYDEAWLDHVARDGESIAYGYDCFLTTDEWTPDHDLNWEYDDDFRVVGVTLDDTYATAYGYDDDGALVFAGDLALNRDAATGFLTNTVVGNVADTRAFNGFGEIVDYAVTASASSLYSATYTRDALGRVASQTETVGAATTEKVYDYDVRGRLASVKTDGVVTEWYAYDRNGNRTNSLAGVSFYDAQDRMTAGVGMSFAYDLNGSQTNRIVNGQPTTFSYDLFGQLKSVTLPDDRVVSYDRDALSRVTAKRIDGVKVKGWIYKDALKPIAETDAAGNVVSFFVYGTSGLSPDYMVKDGVTYRFIRDVQGSVRLVVDSATGAIAQRLDYDTFGNVLLDTNPGFQPFGFQSGLYDPDTALVQFGARWYDPATGRWLSKDPILLEGGLNLYVFCGNDPVNFADPWGLCEADEKISTIQRYLCSNPLLPTGINIFAPDTFALGNNTYVIAGGFYYHSGLFQNNHMDVKAQQPFKKWEVPRQGTMRSDSFGNYLAGYYAGYSGKPSVYILMRAGGFMHSSIGALMKTCGVVGTAEHWTDRDSVPDSNAGFKDGLIDRLFGRDRR